MGLTAGWDEMRDDTILRGVATGEPHLSSDDKDWILWIKPDPAYENLLTNLDGFTNGNREIECEVEPSDTLPGGKNAEDDKTVKQFVGPLKGRRVRVVGTWVRDRQHAVDGSTIILDELWPGDEGKTEIHPITSLLGKLAPPNSMTRRFVFLVFSDDSGGMPPTPAHPLSEILPPHVGEDRRGEFRLAIPAGATITKVEEHAAKAGSPLSITTTLTAHGFSYLEGKVNSGKPDDGKGFYHVVFDVPALFSLRALLESPWDVELPGPCAGLAAELKALKNGTARKFDPKTKEWVEIDSTPGAIAAKQKELDDCLGKHPKKPISVRETVHLPSALPGPCAALAAELKALKNGTARKFDPKTREWVEIDSSPGAIAAKQEELDDCLKNKTPGPVGISIRSLIEEAYP